MEKQKNYSSTVNQVSFKFLFNDWLSVNGNSRRRFSKQTKALINIFANLKYKDTFKSPGQDDEFEHIIPKKRILEYDKNSQINLNSLGNGMILQKYLNLDKQALTIYEYQDKEFNDSSKVNYSDLINKSHYPTEDQFKDIFNLLQNEKFDDVNEYLEERSNDFANEFIEAIL